MATKSTSRSDAVEIHLPGLPPSLWEAYGQRNGKSGKYMTAKATAWVQQAVLYARSVYHHNPLEGRLRVDVRFLVKRRQRFDIDNKFKLLLDALTKARIWNDDSQIDQLSAVIETDGARKHIETVVTVQEVA